jgi:type IV pilus assembly protein PilV
MKMKIINQKGMLLLEVLIAIVIFSFGILGLVGLQASVIANSINAEERSQAALLADEIVSQMWIKNTTSLPTADVSAWTSRVLASKIKATGSVVVSTSRVATISLTWKAPTKKDAEYSNTYSTQVVVD